MAARRKAPQARKLALITGFDAFGGESLNPSWQICEQIAPEVSGVRIKTCRVPCDFEQAIEVVAQAIERHRPSFVICLGQAGGRAGLSVERVAINVSDARIGDNAGKRPIDEAIVPQGPQAYFATLPIKAMVEAIRAAGVPAAISNSAGTFVCNHLMYGVLHYVGANAPATRAGFIHVPYSEEQVIDKPAVPAMSLASMVKGIEAAIVAVDRHAVDVKVADGALD